MFATESDWQRHVIAHARVQGWRVGVASSAHSDPGHPDLTLVHPRGDVVFAELKTDTSQVTRAQRATLEAIKEAGGQAYVWRPRDLAKVIHRLKGHETPDGTVVPRPRYAEATILEVALLTACEAHGLAVEDVVGPSRAPELVAARWDYMLAARTFTSASLPAIGRVIHRDHSTVMHGIRRAQAAANDPQDRPQVQEAIRLAIAGAS